MSTVAVPTKSVHVNGALGGFVLDATLVVSQDYDPEQAQVNFKHTRDNAILEQQFMLSELRDLRELLNEFFVVCDEHIGKEKKDDSKD